MNNRIDLTTGSVAGHVWRMTPPMAVGFLAMMAFNLVDTWFVAKLGTEPLAAMGFTFPIVMVIHSIAMGIGLGVSARVSRALGEGDNEQVQILTTYSLLLATVLMSVIVLVLTPMLPALLTALGAKGRTLDLTADYMAYWLPFVPLIVLPMVGNNAIRATGDTLRPSIIMSVTVLINAILDPLLIFGLGPFPEMGIRGAALATALSRMLSLVGALWLMHRRCHLLTTHWAGVATLFRTWGSVLHIALPSAATNLLWPITMGIVTRMISAHGEVAVAATAAAQRIEGMAHLVPMAMGTSLVPIIGQNWGAGRIDRVHDVWVKTNWYGAIYAVVMLLASIPLATPLARLFSEDPAVVRLITHYLWIVLTGAILLHTFMHTSFAFNAIQRPLQSSALIAFRYIVLVLPLTWLGGRFLGVEGIYGGLAVSAFTSGAVALLWFNRVMHRAAAEATKPT